VYRLIVQPPIRFAANAVATSELPTRAARGIARTTESRGLLALWGGAILLSASLLFLVQPMFARMILPKLGGTPAVWGTCLVFFQTTLLLAYLYVHAGTVRLGIRAQVTIHVALMLATLLVLPIAASSAAPPSGASPTWWLLTTLAASVGLPFFTVAATAPLLQRWFAIASGEEPYFLYAASNFGSVLGLLAYPIAVERLLPLQEQSSLWFAAFLMLVVLMVACGALAASGAANTPGSASQAPREIEAADALAAPAAPLAARLMWLAFAFVPSSLLLGVTTHLSTDVAAVPLLWVVPLAIYLLTFTAAFATRPPISRVWAARLLPCLVLVTLGALLARQRSWWALALHLVTFAAAALVCHRELAERRPAPRELTHFYLCIALGGALGGLFNALLAPLLFTQIVEFPLMLAAAALLRPSPGWRSRVLEPWSLVAGIPCVAFAATLLATMLHRTSGLSAWTIAGVFWFGAAVGLAFANRTLPFAAASIVLAIVYAFYPPQSGTHVIFAARTFFGVHRVVETSTVHLLAHGTTMHGSQPLATRDRCVPTSYYHPSGPIGQVLGARRDRATRVGVIGLGAGALACYGRPGAHWTFYEIDATIERIARDPSLFTHLQNTRAAIDVVIGDGRLTLSATEPASFDAIVVDAFSSDAIPVHLLTREFVATAFERLRPGGIVAFHISNDYFDPEPIVAAASKSLGGTTLSQFFRAETTDATNSKWLVMARDPVDLADLSSDPRWTTARVAKQSWTDDRSNVLDAIIWRR
jgi:SAM-dependent methyltransferase